MSHRKVAFLAVGGGLLLAIAVATIDGIVLARLSGAYVCPDPRCTKAAQFGGSAERAQVVIAFALGYAATFAWLVRPRRLKAPLLAVSGGALLALAVMTSDATIAGRLFKDSYPCPNAACVRAFYQLFEGTDVLIAFVIGFAAAFAWFVRRQRSLIQ